MSTTEAISPFSPEYVPYFTGEVDASITPSGWWPKKNGSKEEKASTLARTLLSTAFTNPHSSQLQEIAENEEVGKGKADAEEGQTKKKKPPCITERVQAIRNIEEIKVYLADKNLPGPLDREIENAKETQVTAILCSVSHAYDAVIQSAKLPLSSYLTRTASLESDLQVAISLAKEGTTSLTLGELMPKYLSRLTTIMEKSCELISSSIGKGVSPDELLPLLETLGLAEELATDEDLLPLLDAKSATDFIRSGVRLLNKALVCARVEKMNEKVMDRISSLNCTLSTLNSTLPFTANELQERKQMKSATSQLQKVATDSIQTALKRPKEENALEMLAKAALGIRAALIKEDLLETPATAGGKSKDGQADLSDDELEQFDRRSDELIAPWREATGRVGLYHHYVTAVTELGRLLEGDEVEGACGLQVKESL